MIHETRLHAFLFTDANLQLAHGLLFLRFLLPAGFVLTPAIFAEDVHLADMWRRFMQN
jgi:hypothetical protein